MTNGTFEGRQVTVRALDRCDTIYIAEPNSSRWYIWVQGWLTKKEVYNKTWKHLDGNVVKYVKKFTA